MKISISGTIVAWVFLKMNSNLIINVQTNLSQKIIEHLKSRKNNKDDYDSLVIAIYEHELRNLADQINKDLSELISRGIIKEYKNRNGKRFIKLIEE